jgi:hypothetical protein
MMNKLMPILAKAVVLPGVLAISGLVGNAQELDRPTDVAADIARYEVLNTLDNAVIESVDADINAIEVFDEAGPVDFDQQLIALDYQPSGVVLDLSANQILDLAEIQPLDHLDIVGTANR